MYTNRGNKADVHKNLNLDNSPEKAKLKKIVLTRYAMHDKLSNDNTHNFEQRIS